MIFSLLIATVVVIGVQGAYLSPDAATPKWREYGMKVCDEQKGGLFTNAWRTCQKVTQPSWYDDIWWDCYNEVWHGEKGDTSKRIRELTCPYSEALINQLRLCKERKFNETSEDLIPDAQYWQQVEPCIEQEISAGMKSKEWIEKCCASGDTAILRAWIGCAKKSQPDWYQDLFWDCWKEVYGGERDEPFSVMQQRKCPFSQEKACAFGTCRERKFHEMNQTPITMRDYWSTVEPCIREETKMEVKV